MKTTSILTLLFLVALLSFTAIPQESRIDITGLSYNIYPELNSEKPDLPSPFTDINGEEYVLAITKEVKYAIIRITLSNDHGICPQLIVDDKDFPSLAENGIHSEEELKKFKFITGRSLDEITSLGRPGGLSQGGFMAEDEDILSVIKADNLIVKNLGLTHPQLAKPLFHVLNMMDTDLSLNRWNMAKHQWDNIQYFYYNNRKVFVEAHDTKGGQKSILDDNMEGAFFIKLWREFDKDENQFLNDNYKNLATKELDTLKTLLGAFNTGEMQPQYIMRYGFYEGHTYWRTDPIAISFIFGLKSLNELDGIFKGELYDIMTKHFVEK